MPQLGTRKEESLFSLELVVEKVYIPHISCRFPAIAFRLLDYPTIVIKHVDDDLGKAIRSKISFDPYYQLPDQFIELKDRHGNFMVNKGKSCLFKIPIEILKQHLESTPLYVMIIDLFPEVPKLIGNSTVPLNILMDSVCNDIAKLGPTVPSVHGDKGLFKLYNLMGKEIGYFVLGFRLLCLGPSLIPHLPESVLLHQHSKGKRTREDKSVDEMIQQHQNQLGATGDSDEPGIQLRSSACMTDPIKHDVLLQTVEMQDKAIHVAVSGDDSQTEKRAISEKGSYSISTQTDRRKKIKETQNTHQKWADFVGHQINDNDDIVVNNIICPPPLFYNSDASPSIKINRQHLSKDHDEIFFDDLSDILSYDGQGLENKEQNIQQEFAYQAMNIQANTDFRSPILPIPQSRVGEVVQGLQVAPASNTVFPLLTALINELSYIQNPQLLLNVSNQMQAASLKIQRSGQSPERKEEKHQIQKNKILSPSVVSAIASALAKKLDNSKESKNMCNTEKPSIPLTVSQITNQVNKQSLKQSSRFPPKKSKLVYKLTNTQRLRLQKTNPQWLKTVEKEVADLKIKKQPAKKEVEVDDISAAMFSDTLTEVRRLAEKELNNTACGDTLLDVTRDVDISPDRTAKHKDINKMSEIKERSSGSAVKKSKQDDTLKRSSSLSLLQKIPSSKNRLRLHSEKVKDSSESDELIRRKPVPQVRHLRDISSPSHVNQELIPKDTDDHLKLDLSSKSHSIDVCLPSPDLDDSDSSIPLPDDSLTGKGESPNINFPKYLSSDISLPETIDGVANASLNVSDALDDNSPLESTRQSKNFMSDQNSSKQLQSTGYDTRQFQSTDEPELQDLVSEEENPSEDVNSGRRSVASMRASQKFPIIIPLQSENSPVPSVRRSTIKQDPTAHSYIPSFSQRFEASFSKSTSPKSKESATKKFKIPALSPKGNDSQSPGLTETDSEKSEADITPRPTSTSPKHPTPQPRKPFRGSLHTDSLSSYIPSDPDNLIVSLSSNSGNYSDDFNLHDIDESEEAMSSVEPLPKLIPSSKLGYTIN